MEHEEKIEAAGLCSLLVSQTQAIVEWSNKCRSPLLKGMSQAVSVMLMGVADRLTKVLRES